MLNIKSNYKMRLSSPLKAFIQPVLLLLLITAGISNAATESEPDTKKSQIKQIESDLSREKEQFLKFDTREKSLLRELSDIEEAIEEKRGVLKELRENIRLSRYELKVRQERLRTLEHSLMEVEELLGERLNAFYKYSKRGYLQILATTSGLNQLNKRMKYLKVIVDEDMKIIKQLAEEQLKYRKELSLIKEQLDVIAGLEEEENSRLSSIRSDQDKKVILLAKIHKEKEFYKTAVQELQLAAQTLKETILNLERDQYSKKPLPSGFAESKGTLPVPLDGKILRNKRRLGAKRLNAHKGIYIVGPLGTEVKAVFPGRVDFSGQLKGYGQVIVINHGSRFFTVSAHLFQRGKAEGEMVAKGEVIGQAGETGWSGPGLYFEMRDGGISLDPLEWLKVD